MVNHENQKKKVKFLKSLLLNEKLQSYTILTYEGKHVRAGELMATEWHLPWRPLDVTVHPWSRISSLPLLFFDQWNYFKQQGNAAFLLNSGEFILFMYFVIDPILSGNHHY